jgi:hypothetical protein
MAERIVPTDSDVLYGRGYKINTHPGNIFFREELVQKYKVEYVAAPLWLKPNFAERIMRAVYNLSPPGRFLKLLDTTDGVDKWVEVSEKDILKKIRQALREGAPNLMKEIATSATAIAAPSDSLNNSPIPDSCASAVASPLEAFSGTQAKPAVPEFQASFSMQRMMSNTQHIIGPVSSSSIKTLEDNSAQDDGILRRSKINTPFPVSSMAMWTQDGNLTVHGPPIVSEPGISERAGSDIGLFLCTTGQDTNTSISGREDMDSAQQVFKKTKSECSYDGPRPFTPSLLTLRLASNTETAMPPPKPRSRNPRFKSNPEPEVIRRSALRRCSAPPTSLNHIQNNAEQFHSLYPNMQPMNVASPTTAISESGYWMNVMQVPMANYQPGFAMNRANVPIADFQPGFGLNLTMNNHMTISEPGFRMNATRNASPPSTLEPGFGMNARNFTSAYKTSHESEFGTSATNMSTNTYESGFGMIANTPHTAAHSAVFGMNVNNPHTASYEPGFEMNINSAPMAISESGFRVRKLSDYTGNLSCSANVPFTMPGHEEKAISEPGFLVHPNLKLGGEFNFTSSPPPQDNNDIDILLEDIDPSIFDDEDTHLPLDELANIPDPFRIQSSELTASLLTPSPHDTMTIPSLENMKSTYQDLTKNPSLAPVKETDPTEGLLLRRSALCYSTQNHPQAENLQRLQYMNVASAPVIVSEPGFSEREISEHGTLSINRDFALKLSVQNKNADDELLEEIDPSIFDDIEEAEFNAFLMQAEQNISTMMHSNDFFSNNEE